MKIEIKSPTRVDLAGGTLDLWPLYSFIGGAITVNVAIDIMTTASLETRPDNKIILESKDLNLRKEYANLDEALRDSDTRLSLLQTQLAYWRPESGFYLNTSSQSPVGGGLGGSSSLTVSLMKAFSQMTQRGFTSTHQLVHASHNIEAEVLNTPTGTQDYYPAASGGINILTYSTDGIDQEVVSTQGSTLEQYFMLVYTGKAHHSGLNNFEVVKDAVKKDARTMTALRDLKKISAEVAGVVKRGQWSALPALFRAEFEARVRLAPGFSSPEIQHLAEVSLQAGAEAVKICGAGGGGCVLLWCPPQRREEVQTACQKHGYQVLSAKPVDQIR